MQPVSVALLAALLPTLLIILALSCLSIFLLAQLREARTKPSTEPSSIGQPPSTELSLIGQPPSTSKEQRWPRTVINKNPDKEPILFLGQRLSGLSQKKSTMRRDLDIFNDAEFWALGQIESWESIVDFEPDLDEAEASHLLAALGYKSMSAAFVLRLLQNPLTVENIVNHLYIDTLLRWTSLEGEPQDSLLPLTAQQHMDLRAYFQALDGLKFPPKVAAELGKLPFTFACEENRAVANYTRLAEIFSKLFRNVAKVLVWVPPTRDQYYSLDAGRLNLDKFVYARFRLLEHFQTYGINWPESTEAKFAVEIEMWTLLGEDGELLEEKKILKPSAFLTIDEDGELGWMRAERVGRGHRVWATRWPPFEPL